MGKQRTALDAKSAPNGYIAVDADPLRCDGCDLVGTDDCGGVGSDCLPEFRRDGHAVVFKRVTKKDGHET